MNKANVSPTEEFQPTVEECAGCDKTVNDRCRAYINPAAWWRSGFCPLASHIDRDGGKEQVGKVRVGQQKQRKMR